MEDIFDVKEENKDKSKWTNTEANEEKENIICHPFNKENHCFYLQVKKEGK